MKTLRDYQECMMFTWNGYGTYVVQIYYRNKWYKCITYNTLAIDRIKSDEDITTPWRIYATKKQAFKDLYNECKWKNNLK